MLMTWLAVLVLLAAVKCTSSCHNKMLPRTLILLNVLGNAMQGNRNTVSWKTATKLCEERQRHLPTITTENNGNVLVQQLRNLSINSSWLAITKSKNDTWLWLDGETADKEFTEQPWRENMECGFLHLRDKIIEAGRCFKNSSGYLCEDKGNRSCNALTVPTSNCSHVDGRTFVYVCGAENWYDAKHKCMEIGTALAVVKLKHVMKSLSKQWYRERTNNCMEVWVGLRQREWMYQKSTNKYKTVPNFWAKGEPSDRGNCAVISNHDNRGLYRWYAKECSSKQNYVCWSEKGKNDELNTSTEAVHPGATNKGFVIIAISISVGVVLLTTTICIIFSRKRMDHGPTRRNDPSQANAQPSDQSIEMEEANQEYFMRRENDPPQANVQPEDQSIAVEEASQEYSMPSTADSSRNRETIEVAEQQVPLMQMSSASNAYQREGGFISRSVNYTLAGVRTINRALE